LYLAKAPALSGFAFDFFDVANAKVGSIRWPDVAIATNARLKNVPKFLYQRLEIEVHGDTFQIEFEYLNRDWVNDIEFRLKRETELLATATVKHLRGSRGARVEIQHPFTGELIRKNTFFAARYDLERGSVKIGAVYERGFSLTRRLWIDLPDAIPAPVQFFLFFLVCNASFR
jgi:hypothetical protein